MFSYSLKGSISSVVLLNKPKVKKVSLNFIVNKFFVANYVVTLGKIQFVYHKVKIYAK